MDIQPRTEEFLAILGHEMRNPLGALSHALQVWPKSAHDAEAMEDLRKIMERQVHQLIRLSDDLLDLARIAHGKLELRRKPFELRQAINGACEEVRPFIDRCGHALSVSMSAEPMVVDGDASRLMQVFANLLQNAAKFTERNGRLCVTVRLHEGTAVVRVCDNGRGLEEPMLQVIFEAFTQGGGAHMPANDGLGIGLMLAKTIVELHGGTITVRSDGLGRGSEFIVQLPVVDKAPHGQQPFMSQPAQRQNGHGTRTPPHRILVVDDDRSSAELLALMLRSIDQHVTVLHDGLTAIRTVRDARPQIVFLDIVMRGMDGCSVARQLRRVPDLAGLFLIALSGNGDEESRLRARDAGFDKYLVKPTSISELAEILARTPFTGSTLTESTESEPGDGSYLAARFSNGRG